jgi:hypothetical protein
MRRVYSLFRIFPFVVEEGCSLMVQSSMWALNGVAMHKASSLLCGHLMLKVCVVCVLAIPQYDSANINYYRNLCSLLRRPRYKADMEQGIA